MATKNWSRTNKIVVGFVVVPLLLVGSCVAAVWVSDADVRERREAETMVHASVKVSAGCSGVDVTLRNDSNLEMDVVDRRKSREDDEVA